MRSIGAGLALIPFLACARTANDATPSAAIDGGADTREDGSPFPTPVIVDSASPDSAGVPRAEAFTDDASLLAVNPNGVYFTSHADPSEVRYIDGDGAIVGIVALPGTAVSLAIDADTLYAGVAMPGGDSPGTVQTIELASGRMALFAAAQNITGVAVDRDTVYWSALDAVADNLGSIRRSPKTGGTTTTVVTTTADAPGPFAIVAGDPLLWATGGWAFDSSPPQYGGSFVFTAPKSTVDGAGTILATPAKASGVSGFARVGTTTVILSAHLGIDVVAIGDDGTSQTLSTFASTDGPAPYAIVSDGARVFWAEAGEHGMIRAWSPGDASAATLARDQVYPHAIAVYEDRVYWTASTGVWSRAK